jgi:hypothetical protein
VTDARGPAGQREKGAGWNRPRGWAEGGAGPGLGPCGEEEGRRAEAGPWPSAGPGSKGRRGKKELGQELREEN